MQQKLLEKYGLNQALIGREYIMKDVLAIMMEQYLIDQGIMKPSENTFRHGRVIRPR